MNILIIGSGGREHALANAYAKNKKIGRIFIVPGNQFIDQTNKKAKSILSVSATDYDGVLKLINKYHVDLVDVAQDDPLAQGFVDQLQDKGIKVFGPTRDASEIEWNKEWARNFMHKYNLPIPSFKSFKSIKAGIAYIKSNKEQILYIKASGLALGKGAIRAESKQEAISAINSMANFGKAGETFLIEECLVGEEFSLFAICDGWNYRIIGCAQDHKTVYNHDHGPNTGGMGCVSNPKIVSKQVIKKVEKQILAPFMQGMQKENRSYTGILYLGGMVTVEGVKIIEFNARWGDPEAEVLLPGIKTDYLTIIEAIINKKLKTTKVQVDGLIRLSVAGCSLGYPLNHAKVKGKIIIGLKKIIKLPNVKIFGAGIGKKGNNFIAHGGRVFHIVGEGKTFDEARGRAYAAMATVGIEGNNLHYRTDIGWRDMERENL